MLATTSAYSTSTTGGGERRKKLLFTIKSSSAPNSSSTTNNKTSALTAPKKSTSTPSPLASLSPQLIKAAAKDLSVQHGGHTGTMSARRSTKQHTHTTTPSPTKLLMQDVSRELARKHQQRITSTVPALLWTPPKDRSALDVYDGQSGRGAPETVTVAIRLLDMTPGFHTGTADSEMHCDDCEFLPRGVGLLMSAVGGSAFFILYLFIVTVIWRRCPQISKPPDAKFKALQEARRPTIKNRLLEMAQQAAGGLGVPVPKNIPLINIPVAHEPLKSNTSADIIGYWTKLAVTHTGAPRSIEIQPSTPLLMTPPQHQGMPPPFLSRLLTAASEDDEEDAEGYNSIAIASPPERALSDVMLHQPGAGGGPPPEVEVHMRRSMSASPGPPIATTRPTSLSTAEVNIISPNEVDNPCSVSNPQLSVGSKMVPKQRSTESSFDSEGHVTRLRPFQLCSPMPSNGHKYTRRRKAKLMRQNSITFSPKWQKEKESPIYTSPPPGSGPPVDTVQRQETTETTITNGTMPTPGSTALLVNSSSANTTITGQTASSGIGSMSASTSINTTQQSVSVNEFGDFVILLPMPRSSTMPGVAGNRLVPRSEALGMPLSNSSSTNNGGYVTPSPIRRLATKRRPGIGPKKESRDSVFVVNVDNTSKNSPRVEDIDMSCWLSKMKAETGALNTGSSNEAILTASSSSTRRTPPDRRLKMASIRDFYSNSKFLFMNE